VQVNWIRLYSLCAAVFLFCLFSIVALSAIGLFYDPFRSLLPDILADYAGVYFLLCLLPAIQSLRYLVNPLKREACAHKVTFLHEIDGDLKELIKQGNVAGNIVFGVFECPGIEAFAISNIFPRTSLIAFSTGLGQQANRMQFDAAIAHELGHIKHGDTLQKSILLAFHAALVWYPFLLSNFLKIFLWPLGLLLVLFLIYMGMGGWREILNHDPAYIGVFLLDSAPFVGLFVGIIILPNLMLRLLNMLFCYDSRRRELAADQYGAQLTSVEAMVSVLKLAAGNSKTTYKVSVFDSHPSDEERLRMLNDMKSRSQ